MDRLNRQSLENHKAALADFMRAYVHGCPSTAGSVEAIIQNAAFLLTGDDRGSVTDAAIMIHGDDPGTLLDITAMTAEEQRDELVSAINAILVAAERGDDIDHNALSVITMEGFDVLRSIKS